MRTRLLLALLLVPPLALLSACDGGGDDDPTPDPTPDALPSGGHDGGPTPGLLEVITAPPATAPAGSVVTFDVFVSGDDRGPTITVERGGGSVEVGPSGYQWTLGVAPVDNRVTVSSDFETVTFTVRATLEEPYRAEAFGDVHGFLSAEGYDGMLESTEDLTFTAAGLLMGAPGGLLHVAPDATVTRYLESDDLTRVWGFAAGPGGILWAVDIGNDRLVRILGDGSVEQALTTDGMQPLVGANYVALDGMGRVYLTDPCLGEIIRLDPMTDEITVHTFDLPTEGGPNGLALSPDGESMYVATENTGLLCSHAGMVGLQDPIAGVYVIDLDDFGTHTPVAQNIGLFGDGLAFDAEGNLYVVVDREENFRLSQSAIVVLPGGEGPPVDFIEADDGKIFANVAFGEGEYGEGMLYIALLAIAGFSDDDSRGLARFEVGIPGLPLPR